MGKLRCPVSSCVFDIVSIWAEECVFCIYSTFASHVFAVFDIVNNWHLCGTCITLSLTHFCSICISLVFPTMYQRQLTLGPAPALDCAALTHGRLQSAAAAPRSPPTTIHIYRVVF